MLANKTTVVIIDDSALMRQMLTAILSSDPEIEVLGAAVDPYVAREMIKALNPDVITLDVEMPRMDGLSFLEKIMRLRPMPVVMVSSLTQKNAQVTLRALELGAVDFIGKPTANLQKGMEALSAELIAKVKAAATARVVAHSGKVPKRSAVKTGPGYSSTEKIVGIGASTGGVEALREVICALPPDCPATLVTQHMPAGFTKSFSERLDSLAQVSVLEACNGSRVLPGHVYIAPGERHLELTRSGGVYHSRVHDGPLVTGHRPSVDVLFRSITVAAGANAIGVVLTGMGRDGTEGLKEMRDAGAVTIGQDEATCLVYGMPQAAMAGGAVEKELPLSGIAAEIVERCKRMD